MPPSIQASLAAAEPLEQRVFQLETLYEIGRECARVERLEDALRIVLSMVMSAFGAVDVLALDGGDLPGHALSREELVKQAQRLALGLDGPLSLVLGRQAALEALRQERDRTARPAGAGSVRRPRR